MWISTATQFRARSIRLDSYSQKGKTEDFCEGQVIIQEMVRSCSAGVIFTKEMKFGAPYFTINYDDVSGRTDTITSGDMQHQIKHFRLSGARQGQIFALFSFWGRLGNLNTNSTQTVWTSSLR